MQKYKKKPNWLKKAKEGIQYLFCWTNENLVYVTKYDSDSRSTYEIKYNACSCPGFRMTHDCCHLRILRGLPDGNHPNTLRRVEIISYVMNTYASISEKVDVDYEGSTTSPAIKFTLTASEISRCRLVFWWDETPVMIDFVPANSEALNEAS